MDSQSTMIFSLGIIGIMFIVLSPSLGLVVAILGGVICITPSLLLYLNVKRSGLLELILPQKRGEILVLYVAGSRRIFPMVGKELLERFIKLPGYGRVRLTKNSDYMLMNKKVVIAKAGIASTIPLEMAQYATALRQIGFKGWKEVEQYMRLTGRQIPVRLEDESSGT